MKTETTPQHSCPFSRLTTALLGLLIIHLTGCASVPEGSAAMKQQALSFTPSPGNADLYVIRPYNYVGGAVLFGVNLDYQEFGALETSSYLFGEVPPGKHVLRAGAGGTPNSQSLAFTAEAGKSYFFTVKPGWVSLDVKQISETDGQNLRSEI